jgi:hypothetical protein
MVFSIEANGGSRGDWKMSDAGTEATPDPEVERLVAVLKKDEEERQDADWDLLAAADPEKLKAAGAAAGVAVE